MSDDRENLALTHLSSVLKEVREDVRSIKDDIHSINLTSVEHKGILDEHIRRTELNEEHINTISDRLIPVERHTAMWAGAGKVVALVATITGIAFTIWKIVESL